MIPKHSISAGRRRRSAGNAMIELAIGATLFTTIFASAFEYGYIFYQYNSLYNAVNNGARYASMYPYDSSSPTYSTNFGNSVQDVVVYGDPSGASTTPVLRNLTTSNVTITPAGVGDSTATPSTWSPTTMTVSITGYTIDGIFGSFTFNGKPTVTYPFVGVYSPQ